MSESDPHVRMPSAKCAQFAQADGTCWLVIGKCARFDFVLPTPGRVRGVTGSDRS